MTFLKRRINLFRFWAIKRLVGKMPIAANIRISDYDADGNFNTEFLYTRPHMFYNNKIYDMAKYIEQEVYSGNAGSVRRCGNTFILSKF